MTRGLAAAAAAVLLLLAAACGNGAPDPAGVRGGQPSDVDPELPVPEGAEKGPVQGSYRVSQAPEQVFTYYERALPDNGWAIEKESSQTSGPIYVLVVCRQRQWNSVGINPDRSRPGMTLLVVSRLEGESDRCP